MSPESHSSSDSGDLADFLEYELEKDDKDGREDQPIEVTARSEDRSAYVSPFFPESHLTCTSLVSSISHSCCLQEPHG